MAQATLVLKTDEIIPSGDYAIAPAADTIILIQDGRQMSETGKWMSVYRREPDGSWKYHWSTSNSNE